MGYYSGNRLEDGLRDRETKARIREISWNN